MLDVIYMFAMSLDGFIAREDGSFDWLDDYPPDADYDFDAFLASVTGIVMGRGTYDDGAARRPLGLRRNGQRVVATSRRSTTCPPNAEAMAGTPAELLANLRRRGADGRIWMLGGGDVARQFLEAGLLDTIEIGVIPVIIGSGLPAFGGAQPTAGWNSTSQAAGNGAVHCATRAALTPAKPVSLPSNILHG